MKNHFEIHGESVKVYSNGRNKALFFWVDLESLEKISEFSWRVYTFNKKYNAVETSYSYQGKIRHMLLSRFLMGHPEGRYIDHIDQNPCNNRMNNLRLCNRSENCSNVKKSEIPKSSIYKGVSWHKRKNKWITMISHNKKIYHLGYFVNEIDAAKCYDQKAKELHGDFANLNFK